MADRPLIMSAPMVRALLDGRKRQTRRIVPRPTDHFHASYTVLGCEDGHHFWSDGQGGMRRPAKVPWAVGDRLWVRENWRTSVGVDGKQPSVLETPGNGYGWPVWYGADDGAVSWRGAQDGGASFINPGKGRPSIHMPRWASRLTLVVTGVRVERLQSISEADAEAEGVETDVWDMAPVAKRYGTDGWFVGWPMGISDPSVCVDAEEVCRRSFASLWNSIHGPDAWDANPWVAVISFETHRANIDALDIGEAA